MITPRIKPSSRRCAAFTLMEVLIAIGIFAVGMVAVAAVFPAAIYLQKQTIQDATSQQVARNATAIMQSVLFTYDWDGTNPGGNLADYYTTGHDFGGVQALPFLVSGSAAVPNGYTGDTVMTTSPAVPAFSEDLRSYPSYIQTSSSRKYFWQPFVKNQGGNPASTSNPWVFYVFVMTSTPEGVPQVHTQTVTVDASNPSQFNFGSNFNDNDSDGNLDWLHAGDVVLDNTGTIHQITEAASTYIVTKSIIVGSPTKIFFGRGPDNVNSRNKTNPTTRIIPVDVVVKDPTP